MGDRVFLNLHTANIIIIWKVGKREQNHGYSTVLYFVLTHAGNLRPTLYEGGEGTIIIENKLATQIYDFILCMAMK